MSTQSVQSYLTSLQNATAQVDNATAQERVGNDTLDKYAFLRLMTEQLKCQDPLNPMDNSQFLSQQAQFTQIEELQNLSSVLQQTSSLGQASSFIGKSVTVTDPDDDTNTITGTVTAAHSNSNGASVEINGTTYPIDLILTVKNSTEG
ncbi:MAG: flagellar hook capping FlgD N-terminal domain-containing protein [Vampirovibrionia bacterium]